MLDIFFEKRGAKMLLPLKPKPCQTAAISGKQDSPKGEGNVVVTTSGSFQNSAT